MRTIVCMIFIAFSAASAAAQTLTYSADSIEYIAAENRFVLTGNCVIGYDKALMKADAVYYMVDEEHIIAMGNIDFSQGGSRFTGKTLEYDMRLKRAVLSIGRAPVEKGFIAGRTMNAVGEDLLYGKDTTFTTCDSLEPHFRVESKRMKVIKGDKIVVSPVVIYVYNVPVFWFPSYFFPIPEGRKSGFLQPTFSNNSSDGITYEQPFFLVLNRYSDLTYILKIMSVRGVSQEGEIRFKTRSGGGTIEGAFIDDRIDNSKRWYLEGDATQEFKKAGIKMTLKADLSSDTDYYADFSSNIDERTENILASYLTLEKQFGSKAYLRVNMSNEKQWWDEADGTTSETSSSELPGAKFNVYNVLLADSLYLSGTSELSNGYIDNEFSRLTLDNTVSLTYKHVAFDYLNFSETLSNYYDIYTDGDLYVDRWVPSFSTGVFFDLYGYFNFLGLGATDTVKHTIKPAVSFNYIPDIDQAEFTDTGGSAVARRENFSYRLDNSFVIKLNNGRKHVFMSLSSYITQDLLQDKEFSYLSDSLTFSPYLGEGLSTRFSLLHQYDTYARESESFYVSNNSSYTSGGNRIDLYGYYRKDFDGDDDVFTSRIQATVNLTKNWQFKTSILYDFKESKIREQTFEFFRNLHCWNMGITWQERETGVIDYKFFIKLNAYGDFKWDYSGELETGGGVR